MRFKVFIVSVIFVSILLPGISLAQNKVVVIPLMSGNNEILTVTSATGRVWMDRNLGAFRAAKSRNDYRAYGWLYQWGRLADGHEVRSSPTTTNLSWDNVPGHNNFITVDEDPNDWRDPQHHGLWNPLFGLNNPCPDGFRVPTEAEWETERASWSSNDAAGAFASPLKLVGACDRSHNDGSVTSTTHGFYWSSTSIGSLAAYLRISSFDAWIGNASRANGFSVRCIKQ